jgi:GH35 family endo-1,4-beta-xylanase
VTFLPLRLPLAVALLCAAAAAVVPAPARASAGMELALQDDPVFVEGLGMSQARALAAAQRLGAKRIRVNVLWTRVMPIGASSRKAPRHPFYDFGQLDQLQHEAAKRHIKLQFTLAGPAPAWATKNHRVGPYWPSASRYAQFVNAVATHFKGRVERYSLWNEPNWNTWLAPSNHAAGIYRDLYTRGYAAVKKADPRAEVLIGELAPQGGGHAIAPLKFLRQITGKGGRLKADGFAIHPYQLTSAPTNRYAPRDDVTIGTLDRLTRVLNTLAHRHKLTRPNGSHLNLYLTEFGYLSKGSRAQSAATRARWLASAYKIARRNPRVKQLLQYQLIDKPSHVAWHSAVMSQGGKPFPAYTALRRLVHH